MTTIDDRIGRRLDRVDGGPVRSLDLLCPVTHAAEPVGRGPTVERLLDRLSPAFEGVRPPPLYVHGPKGVGKTAVVGATVDRLAAVGVPGGPGSGSGSGSAAPSGAGTGVVPTATRSARPIDVAFARVDARRADSEFALYRATLDALTDERVPDRGVGADSLRRRLADAVEGLAGAVVVVDHVAGDDAEGDPRAPATVASLLTDVHPGVVPILVGRADPASLPFEPARTLAVSPLDRHALADVLAARAERGLARDAVRYESLRRLATWADGDVHDGLAALAGAALAAADADRDRVTAADVDAGTAAVPDDAVALGRVLALDATRRRVLAELVELPDADRASVGRAAAAVATRVDLSPATVERMCYELADVGAVRRVRAERSSGTGRPPSRVEPTVPSAVFRALAGDP